MNYDQWEEMYRPIKNHFHSDDGVYTFETYGNEYDFIVGSNPQNVWTLVDGEDGTYIVSGLHYVNRIAYLITEKSHSVAIEVLDMLYGETEDETSR